MEKMDVIEQWLNTMSAGKSEHKHNLKMFLDFTDKSAQQILDEYKAS